MAQFVLVTGGAGGIGLAVTNTLASSGYKVFCCDIKNFAGEKNENITPLVMDVTSTDSIQTALKAVKQQTDTLLAVINCAGIFIMNSVVEIEEEQFVKILNVNLLGMYRVNKIFLPLLKGGYSRIINISSEVARYSSPPFNGPYTASKFAVEAYTDALRRELMLLNIPVVKIRPGSLNTNMLKDANAGFETLLKSTQYFKNSLSQMNNMMQHELNKTNDPVMLARLIKKIIECKKPKIMYRIVNSKKLGAMGALPEKLQDKLYKLVVGSKKDNK